jgi:hypothetical protein
VVVVAVEAMAEAATAEVMVVVVDMEAAPTMRVRSMAPPKVAAMVQVADTMTAVGTLLRDAEDMAIRSGSLKWRTIRGGLAQPLFFDTSIDQHF